MKKLSVLLGAKKRKAIVNKSLVKQIIEEMDEGGIDIAAEYFFASLEGFIENVKDPVAKKAYVKYIYIFGEAAQQASGLMGNSCNEIMGSKE